MHVGSIISLVLSRLEYNAGQSEFLKQYLPQNAFEFYSILIILKSINLKNICYFIVYRKGIKTDSLLCS